MAETPPRLFEHILHTEAAVATRVEGMATELLARYPRSDDKAQPLFVCLLRGGAPFSMQLMSAIAQQDPHFHPELDYMTVRTYGNERQARPPELVMDLSPGTSVTDRPIVILDDLLDTGLTTDYVAANLSERGAGPIEICVLAQKNKGRPDFRFAGPVYYGFETPDVWLTGMGMNDSRPGLGREGNRWAGYIAVAVAEHTVTEAAA